MSHHRAAPARIQAAFDEARDDPHADAELWDGVRTPIMALLDGAATRRVAFSWANSTDLRDDPHAVLSQMIFSLAAGLATPLDPGQVITLHPLIDLDDERTPQLAWIGREVARMTPQDGFAYGTITIRASHRPPASLPEVIEIPDGVSFTAQRAPGGGE